MSSARPGAQNRTKTYRRRDAWIAIHDRGRVVLLDLVDADLAPRVQISGNGFAYVDGVGLQRIVLKRIAGRELPTGVKASHANGNPLDNRRRNIRRADAVGAARNARAKHDGFKGVTLEKRDQRFKARICVNGNVRNLGQFGSAEEAARAYDAAARAAFGAFARVNFP